MANDYLFTWTPKGWPYEKLRALVDDFDAGKNVTEPWRCLAHTMVQRGNSAYFLKQGNQPRGIFGVGTVTGNAFERTEAAPGENRWQVPITFNILVDPIKELLVTEEQLAQLPAPDYRWRPMGSGVNLESAVARKIDELISLARNVPILPSDAANTDKFDLHDAEDARERINRSIAVRRGQQEFRLKLLAAYGGKCAVTGCDVEDLLEAAHIVPYRGPQTNHVQNGLLLRADIHTLFDCGLFVINPSTMKLILSPRLLASSYRKLAERPLRLPENAEQKPSPDALAAHRRLTGL